MQKFHVFKHVLCFSTLDTKKTCYIIKHLVNGSFLLVHFVVRQIYHNDRKGNHTNSASISFEAEKFHKWLKIFEFTDYSKDWEQIILGGSPETRQWKGKTV